MTPTCARPGCGNELVVPATGRTPRYCSSACRKAASRGRSAAEGVAVEAVGAPVTKLGQRAAQRVRYVGQLCPTDPSHGPLLPLAIPTARGEGWYCPNQTHDPSRREAGTRPFFTTDELHPASPRTADPDLAGGAGVPLRAETRVGRPSEAPSGDAVPGTPGTEPATSTDPAQQAVVGASLNGPDGGTSARRPGPDPGLDPTSRESAEPQVRAPGSADSRDARSAPVPAGRSGPLTPGPV
jgi:hypothetical protein